MNLDSNHLFFKENSYTKVYHGALENISSKSIDLNVHVFSHILHMGEYENPQVLTNNPLHEMK